MTKPELKEYVLRNHINAFEVINLLWPMVEAAKNVVGSKSADLHLDLDMALASLKQKIEGK